MTTPATETKSIGLPASAQVSCLPERPFGRAGFLQAPLINFTLTWNFRPIYRDSRKKPRHRDPNDLTVVRAGADGN
jgi:hypothetical protein